MRISDDAKAAVLLLVMAIAWIIVAIRPPVDRREKDQ